MFANPIVTLLMRDLQICAVITVAAMVVMAVFAAAKYPDDVRSMPRKMSWVWLVGTVNTAGSWILLAGNFAAMGAESVKYAFHTGFPRVFYLRDCQHSPDVASCDRITQQQATPILPEDVVDYSVRHRHPVRYLDWLQAGRNRFTLQVSKRAYATSDSVRRAKSLADHCSRRR